MVKAGSCETSLHLQRTTRRHVQGDSDLPWLDAYVTDVSIDTAVGGGEVYLEWQSVFSQTRGFYQNRKTRYEY
jgi:hypothetical protein